MARAEYLTLDVEANTAQAEKALTDFKSVYGDLIKDLATVARAQRGSTSAAQAARRASQELLEAERLRAAQQRTLRASLNAQTAAQKKVTAELKAQAAAQRVAARSARSVNRSNSALEDGFGQLGGRVGSLGSLLIRLGPQATAVGAAFSAASAGVGVFVSATQALARVELGFLKDSVSTAAQFGLEIRRVGAISGATADQLDELRRVAIEQGRVTSFTITQSAEALRFLAQAGLSTEESTTALAGTLQLAEGGFVSAGKAADIATNAMSLFGFQATELERVNDVLLKTTTSTNTNLSQLGTQLTRAGAAAQLANIPFVEVNAALGLLASRGQAATSGRGFAAGITNLIKPSQQAAAALKAANVQVKDQRGEFLGLQPVLANFREAIDAGRLSTEDLARIFSANALRAFSPLIRDTSGELAGLIDTLDRSNGAARKLSETVRATLQKSFEQLVSQTEALKIGLGDELTPAAQAATRDLTGLVGTLTESTELREATRQLGLVLPQGLAAAASAAQVALPILAQVIGVSIDFGIAVGNWAGPIAEAGSAISQVFLPALGLLNAGMSLSEVVMGDSSERAKEYANALGASTDATEAQVNAANALLGPLAEFQRAQERNAEILRVNNQILLESGKSGKAFSDLQKELALRTGQTSAAVFAQTKDLEGFSEALADGTAALTDFSEASGQAFGVELAANLSRLDESGQAVYRTFLQTGNVSGELIKTISDGRLDIEEFAKTLDEVDAETIDQIVDAYRGLKSESRDTFTSAIDDLKRYGVEVNEIAGVASQGLSAILDRRDRARREAQILAAIDQEQETPEQILNRINKRLVAEENARQERLRKSREAARKRVKIVSDEEAAIRRLIAESALAVVNASDERERIAAQFAQKALKIEIDLQKQLEEVDTGRFQSEQARIDATEAAWVASQAKMTEARDTRNKAIEKLDEALERAELERVQRVTALFVSEERRRQDLVLDTRSANARRSGDEIAGIQADFARQRLDAERALQDQLSTIAADEDLSGPERDRLVLLVEQNKVIADQARARALEAEIARVRNEEESRSAGLEIDKLKALGEQNNLRVIELELAKQIRDIQNSDVSSSEKALEIERARLEASRRRAEEIGNLVGSAVSQGLSTEGIGFDQTNAATQARLDALEQQRQALEGQGQDTTFLDRRIEQLNTEFELEQRNQALFLERLDGLASISSEVGKFAEQIALLGEIETDTAEGVAEARKVGNDALLAGLTVAAGVSKALIKSDQARARVLGAIELAKAVAVGAEAIATFNPALGVAAAQHGLAAAKFFAAARASGSAGGAGGGISSGAGVGTPVGTFDPSERQASAARLGEQLADAYARRLEQRTEQIFNVNLNGPMLANAPDTAREIKRIVDDASINVARSVVGA